MDRLLKFASPASRIRATYTDVSDSARELSRRHLLGPSASYILGEALTAVSLLSADMTHEDECVTLRLDVDGLGPCRHHLLMGTGNLYTRTGDLGETSLGDGSRVRKDCPRIEACGCIDELNAAMGVLRGSFSCSQHVLAETVTTIQNDLFCIGARLANPSGGALLPPIPTERVSLFESEIDRMTTAMPSLGGFILPGGSGIAALAHVARTVCRRAERRVATLCPDPETADDDIVAALQYLNRLADYLFCQARYSNFLADLPDPHWKK